MKDRIPLRLDPDRLRQDNVASLVRAALATALAARDGTRPTDVARKMYGDDRAVALVLRAAVSPTSIAGAPAATRIAAAFLDALVGVSAGADLLGRGVQLNFASAASITVPIPVKTAPTTPGPTLARRVRAE